RGAVALPAGARLAYTPSLGGVVPSLAFELQMEADIRIRNAICRVALHPPFFARVGRLPRRAGRAYAPTWAGLLREQPPRRLRTAAICDPQPQALRRLWRPMLGCQRERRSRPGGIADRWSQALLLRLP